MQLPKDISEYLRAWAPELGERILQTYPPLHGFEDATSPLTGQLLRKPFPAQTLAMMGVVKRWNEARGAAVIAECGTGKTLITLGAVPYREEVVSREDAAAQSRCAFSSRPLLLKRLPEQNVGRGPQTGRNRAARLAGENDLE